MFAEGTKKALINYIVSSVFDGSWPASSAFFIRPA